MLVTHIIQYNTVKDTLVNCRKLKKKIGPSVAINVCMFRKVNTICPLYF